MEPGPQFHQLAMFHTADELKNNVTPLDAWQHASPAAMWDHKLQQNQTWAADLSQRAEGTGPTMHESIGQQGVHTPVELMHSASGNTRLTEGHHRVASAFAHNPQSLIPVLHHEQFDPAVAQASERPHSPYDDIALSG